MLHALAFGGEGGLAVEAVHGAVEVAVGAAEGGRHEVGVVEVRKGRLRVAARARTSFHERRIRPRCPVGPGAAGSASAPRSRSQCRSPSALLIRRW